MPDFERLRRRMVEEQIYARGVRDHRVLEAMARVPRELFLPASLRAAAYEDRPLWLSERYAVPQPYVVAYMVEALLLEGGERVLEIDAGTGYAAAVLAEIAAEVFAVEPDAEFAAAAERNLAAAGYRNVRVRHGESAVGWPEEAPFAAILVSGGMPRVPRALLEQLEQRGRMVLSVGSTPVAQELVRITRLGAHEFVREELADVRYVPLLEPAEEAPIGVPTEEPAEAPAEAPAEPPAVAGRARWGRARVTQTRPAVSLSLAQRVAAQAEAFEEVEEAALEPLLERIGDARVVLIGEASHGTSEFYRMRAAITRRLIAERGFTIVAAEADWPDAARIDSYVRHREAPSGAWTSFARFPTWMWRNEETRAFVDWLHAHNAELPPEQRAGFYGLDIYSLYTSIHEVIRYLDEVDPELARIARQRYGCLTPWEADPAAYGHAALTGAYRQCEEDVAAMLTELLRKRQALAAQDDERLFDAEQNAALIAAAERYYRIMYYGSRASWNLRDAHMFTTLQRVMAHRGPGAKAVVWAHNSHIGDASATEMSARGEFNIGQLCRQEFGRNSYHIGFGTDHGTVAAAAEWGGPMQIMQVRPAHPQSYERIFHLGERPGLLLPLRQETGGKESGGDDDVRKALLGPRLERAIGVIYRPASELASHYFEAVLPEQFDEYIWIDETHAVTPIETATLQDLPDTYPFGV